MASSIYRVVITDKNGVAIGEIIDFTSIRFERRLNNYGTCTVVVPGLEPGLDALIGVRVYEMKIYRNNTLVWAGEQANVQGEISDNSIEPITITAFDYLEQFNNRFTPAISEFLAEDAGQIAWELIDASQNETDGDFGITEGTIEVTQDRDRTYYNQNIMEAIVNLSNVVGGFDFEITNDKVFNVYASKGLDRSETVSFEYGINIQDAKIQMDHTNPVNEAISLGEGFGASQLREVAIDVEARETYRLRQGVLFDPEVTESSTLLDKGEELLRTNKQPQIKISFTQVSETLPSLGTLELGDTVKIRIIRGIWNIFNNFRIYGLIVSIDDKNNEEVEYIVSSIA